MVLSALHVYPVKSLRGCVVEVADVDDLGLVGDRRFLVVDQDGRFLTQRAVPRMALVETSLTPDALTLAEASRGSISVRRDADPAAPLRTVSVWRSEGLLAEDCGDDVAAWLGEVLHLPCRLVRIGQKFIRPVLKQTAGPGDRVGFADAFPFLVVSEASLADLNDRLLERGEAPVPMNRFRPNLVVSGCAAFDEDRWPRVRIGDITFRAGGPCTRCILTTTDQETGQRGKEPLRTLATYRRNATDPTDVDFGQNLIHETKSGRLRVGDRVEPLG